MLTFSFISSSNIPLRISLPAHSYILFIQPPISLSMHTSLSCMPIHLYTVTSIFTHLHIFLFTYICLLYLSSIHLHLPCHHIVTDFHTAPAIHLTNRALSPHKSLHGSWAELLYIAAAPSHISLTHTHIRLLHQLLTLNSLSHFSHASSSSSIKPSLSSHSAISFSQHTHAQLCSTLFIVALCPLHSCTFHSFHS